ncbi:unnamed protein product [Adineta ricciae]|uniref:G-protein coupled receptors family 1 profile domain-containing protein n=1 Tax=Adineta ricciae TaxID=249248 RepID=A0A815LU04_ADIRI|nr:unnamed protein product [Adineta ricciae]
MSLAAILDSIQTNLFRFGGPFVIINATISCILNLLVFTKPTLRKNPCSICFIAVTIANTLYLYFVFILQVTQVGYNTDPSITNIIYCRIRLYSSCVGNCLGPSFLILASIDRTLITSKDAGVRKRSSNRLAITCIIVLTIFWMLFHIHAFFFAEIIQVGPNMLFCFSQPGGHTVFTSYFALVFNAIIVPLCIILFGLWTVKNVKKVHNRVRPAGSLGNTSTTVGKNQHIGSKDHQLIRILLIDILTYIIFRVPFALFLVYQQITQYQLKSNDQIAIDYFGFNITYFLFLAVAAINCYTNLLVSKTFRAELKQTFLKCGSFCFVQQREN